MCNPSTSPIHLFRQSLTHYAVQVAFTYCSSVSQFTSPAVIVLNIRSVSLAILVHGRALLFGFCRPAYPILPLPQGVSDDVGEVEAA